VIARTEIRLRFATSSGGLILALHRAGGAGIDAAFRRDDLDSCNLEQFISRWR
jgi:hypothetical protein